MVSDHQPVERTAKLGRLTARRHDFFAAGEAIGVIKAEASAEQAGIHREAGVQVGVAPEDLVGEAALGVWRVGFAGVKVR